MTEADSASAGMTLPDVWRSHLADGVGVALRDHKAGEWIELDGIVLRLPEAIPRGHKFALRPHNEGEPVLRYGAPINVLDEVSDEDRITLARAIAKTDLADRETRLKELLEEQGYGS